MTGMKIVRGKAVLYELSAEEEERFSQAVEVVEEVTEAERMRADLDFLMAMGGYVV